MVKEGNHRYGSNFCCFVLTFFVRAERPWNFGYIDIEKNVELAKNLDVDYVPLMISGNLFGCMFLS